MVNGMLAPGQTLVTEEGEKLKVADMFGSGGQGEVYRVRTRKGERALKWYYPQLADGRQRQILEGLIGCGWSDDRFLWPQTVVVDADGKLPGFGYLMDVRPERFHDLPALFRRDPALAATTQRTLVMAALHTVEAYRALHGKGIAYRDINWGNIFFDPHTGDVLVCDNDNAVFEGESAGVAGTMDFMAPELVRGERGAQPGIQSDLHSLAVLLFLLLMNHHPLEGAQALQIRCMDENARKKLYGTDPVFLYDPNDKRNRPVPEEQQTVVATWGALPPTLRELFVETFTEGLKDPNRRVREGTWLTALSEVLDTICTCASCGRQNLTEPDGPAPQCWGQNCRRPLTLPPRLQLTTGTAMMRSKSRSVRLGPQARLYAHHLAVEAERHDFSAVVAQVTEHPKQRGRFGITNRSQNSWTARRSDGSVHDVDPGRTVALSTGLQLEFGGGAEAVVRD
ncbi:protein kinase [Streptomyces sp. NBC_01613]|uniref:protein kinase domain-containing protein n=1 Tax=Streptomyces sp. NBC_01613 TaxID=2975896 RepID=UPI0038641E35